MFPTILININLNTTNLSFFLLNFRYGKQLILMNRSPFSCFSFFDILLELCCEFILEQEDFIEILMPKIRGKVLANVCDFFNLTEFLYDEF